MIPFLKAPPVLALVLLAASCTSSSGWENPKAQQSQWPRDHAACKRKATAEVEKEAAADYAYRDVDISSTSSLSANMARHNIGKRRDRMIADCMRRLGYIRKKKRWF